MNIRSRASSFGLAWALSRDIRYGREQLPLEARRAGLSARLGVPLTGVDFEINRQFYQHAIYRSGDVTIITIAGVESVEMARRLGEGYQTNPRGQEFYPCHPVFRDNAVNIWGACAQNGHNMNGRLIVAGYSGGGGCAEALAGYWWRRSRQIAPTCITYGTPRVGGESHVRTMDFTDQVRYMALGDPVPYLPAHAGQGGLNRALAGATIRAAWDRYIHSRNGSFIQGTDNPVDVADVETSGRVDAANVYAWAFGLTQASVIAHSIGNYEAMLSALADRNADGDFVNDDVPQNFPLRLAVPPPVPVPELPAEQIVRQAALAFAARQQSPSAPKVFTYRKVGITHAVCADGVAFDYHATKRQAKIMVKNLNRVLASWEKSLFGDDGSLQAAVINHFIGGPA